MKPSNFNQQLNAALCKSEPRDSMSVSLEQAAEFFCANDNFTLLCHANPDGDTLGSGYALCGVLHITGKHARVVCADEASPRFDYLKDAINPDLLAFPENTPELIVTIDVADTELLGDLKDKYPRVDFCIDHHISNKNYAEQTLLDSTAAACAEVVWDLIGAMGVYAITPEIAAAAYTGVSTDTGCFRFSNTTAKSHAIAAELMEYKFDVARVNYLMFELKTRARIELERQAYSGIEFFFGGKCAVITLTAAMLDGIDPADTSNVSVLPKQVEGVEAGVILKERVPKAGEPPSEQMTWKISVRTNANVDAQTVCSALGGGGHKRAAGCKLSGDSAAVKAAVLAEVEKQLSCTE
jgi:phosphoesterase RecJ-like protein